MKFLLIAAAAILAQPGLAPAAEADTQIDHSKMHHEAAGDTEASNADPHAAHAKHGMTGMYGAYPMTREASGTSWQPDSAPHDGIHDMAGEWSTMLHGFVNVIGDKQGGPRGASKTFSTSMLMFMGQRAAGAGTLGFRSMVSLDPLMGKDGYPELFQTGETADGVTPLVDRQHPHDMLMELAATYSYPVSEHSSVFAYVGLPGEPALGPAAFMHRFSGIDNPEAPITHHWLDSTHVVFGVTTLGYVYKNWKLEASVFRGREPDQFRYNIETGKLDSHSARLTWNPASNWSAQMSVGRIKSPEALEPDVDVKRTTASITANLPLGTDNWQTMLAWGRNAAAGGHASDAYLLESAYSIAHSHTFFMRAENADKHELFAHDSPLGESSFRINKLSAGYVYDFPSGGHVRLGIGGLLSAYQKPDALAASYGGNPRSGMLFVRLKIQ